MRICLEIVIMERNFSKRREKMKIIEVDEELYQYIAGKTQSIGESASDILRRLLNLPHHAISQNDVFDSEESSQISKNKEHSASVFVEKNGNISTKG